MTKQFAQVIAPAHLSKSLGLKPLGLYLCVLTSRNNDGSVRFA